MATLIGSIALAHWLPLCREPADYDLIINAAELEEYRSKYKVHELYPNLRYSFTFIRDDGKRRAVELEVSDNLPSAAMVTALAAGGETKVLPFGQATIAPLNVLFTIKKAHLVGNIKWWKHIDDYHYMKPHAELITDLFELRRAETLARLRMPQRYKFNVTNEEFFRPSVQRHIPHDDLHSIVAYYSKPMYTKIKRDLSMAMCDQDLFESLSHDDQVKCVREELFALTLERFIVHEILAGHNWEPESEAYARKMLSMMGTHVTSGWFREFIHDNAYEIIGSDLNKLAAAGKIVADRLSKEVSI